VKRRDPSLLKDVFRSDEAAEPGRNLGSQVSLERLGAGCERRFKLRLVDLAASVARAWPLEGRAPASGQSLGSRPALARGSPCRRTWWSRVVRKRLLRRFPHNTPQVSTPTILPAVALSIKGTPGPAWMRAAAGSLTRLSSAEELACLDARRRSICLAAGSPIAQPSHFARIYIALLTLPRPARRAWAIVKPRRPSRRRKARNL